MKWTGACLLVMSVGAVAATEDGAGDAGRIARAGAAAIDRPARAGQLAAPDPAPLVSDPAGPSGPQEDAAGRRDAAPAPSNAWRTEPPPAPAERYAGQRFSVPGRGDDSDVSLYLAPVEQWPHRNTSFCSRLPDGTRTCGGTHYRW